jgi:hypothetical protein
MKGVILFIIAIILSGNALAKISDIQTINSFSLTEGKAFGYKNQKETFNNFTEIPLSNKASIGGTFQGSHIDSNYHGSTKDYAINSVEIFSRYKIFSHEKLGITMHNAFKFPGIYNENKYLAQMPKQSDYEFRLLFAHNMKDRLVNTVLRPKTPYFLRGEIAYRRRFNNPFDEIRFALWAGININQKFALLLQDNINWNLESRATALNNTYSNLQLSKDANNIATLSLIYRFEKDMALQVGYIRRVGGNNPFYEHSGVIIGLWNSF